MNTLSDFYRDILTPGVDLFLERRWKELYPQVDWAALSHDQKREFEIGLLCQYGVDRHGAESVARRKL